GAGVGAGGEGGGGGRRGGGWAWVRGTATKASPGFTLRLSTATPPIARPPWRSSNAASGKSSRRIMMLSVPRSPHGAERNAGFPDFRPHSRASIRATISIPRLPGVLGGGKDELVGGRQVEARLKAEDGRDAGDHLAGDRDRVPAGGGEAVGFRRRLRLVDHDQQEITRLIGRQDRHEAREHLGLGITAADDLVRRAGL